MFQFKCELTKIPAQSQNFQRISDFFYSEVTGRPIATSTFRKSLLTVTITGIFLTSGFIHPDIILVFSRWLWCVSTCNHVTQKNYSRRKSCQGNRSQANSKTSRQKRQTTSTQSQRDRDPRSQELQATPAELRVSSAAAAHLVRLVDLGDEEFLVLAELAQSRFLVGQNGEWCRGGSHPRITPSTQTGKHCG